MYIERGDLRLRGNLSMTNCSSLGSGGGLLMDRGGFLSKTDHSFAPKAAKLAVFQECISERAAD